PSSLPLSSPHSPPHLHLYFSPAPPSPPSSASPVFLSCYAHPPDLHSFPTRRSSDLTYGLTMNAVLKALGMPSAFCESQRADFTRDRKSTRLNSSHVSSSYAVFCLKKKTTSQQQVTTVTSDILVLNKLDKLIGVPDR